MSSIGVFNLREPDLERFLTETGVKPVLNQIEMLPSFQQRRSRELHMSQGIYAQCWSPLG